MKKFYIDHFLKYKEIIVDSEIDLLTAVRNEQNNNSSDLNRFYLRYIPQDILNEFDLTDCGSSREFRDKYILTFDSPVKPMCACNLMELFDDIRYNGLKISDPYGNICGVFDIRNNIITYSPIFPHVYKERDIVKFANTVYFTPVTFEDIMKEQIYRHSSYYVHVGDYTTLKDIRQNGKYILEKIDKNQMLDFVNNPNEGARIYKRHMGID